LTSRKSRPLTSKKSSNQRATFPSEKIEVLFVRFAIQGITTPEIRIQHLTLIPKKTPSNASPVGRDHL